MLIMVSMNKLLKKLIIITASFALAFLLIFIIYLVRAPVLIVTDLGFIPFYGERRIKSESLRSSLSLFRRVKTVGIADDAADEVVKMAVSDISRRPYCVIFPFRFSGAARLYREQYSGVPVVILEGMQVNSSSGSVLESSINDYFIYQTDIAHDFHLAGLAAAALDIKKSGQIAVFMDNKLQLEAKKPFLDAIDTQNVVFFNSFSGDAEYPEFSCIVLAGTGAGILEERTDVPVIAFTWIDPELLPGNIIAVFNDSPWSQAVKSVRMVSSGITKGKIKSALHITNKKKIDKDTLRKLLK